MFTILFRFNLFLITIMITNQYALSRFNHRFDNPQATITPSKSMAVDASILGELRRLEELVMGDEGEITDKDLIKFLHLINIVKNLRKSLIITPNVYWYSRKGR